MSKKNHRGSDFRDFLKEQGILGVEYDERGNVKSVNNATNLDKIFVGGDATRGASLVVWAIRSGRDAAKRIHQFVTK